MTSANRIARSRGFTLIELLVTMTMAAIMMTLAVPSLRTLWANQQLSGAASELVTTAMQARSAALKYNQRVIVRPTDESDWTKGWQIFVDTDRNNSYGSTTDTLVVTMEAMPDGISVEKVTGSNNFFGYDGSGFLAPIGGSANSSWKVTSSKTDRVRCLLVERSGRARVHDPGPSGSCPSS